MTKFIHRFLPASGELKRVLLLLHGTGGTESDLLELGRMLDPDAALLSPRGQVLEHGQPRFFRRLAEGVFDIGDLVKRTHELANFIDFARSQYALSDSEIVAVGYSNGANIAASMLLLRPSVLMGAVLFRPMVPFTPNELPDLAGRRVLISAGERDPIIDPSQSQELSELLKKCSAEVSLAWQHAGHELGLPELQAAQRWLAR